MGGTTRVVIHPPEVTRPCTANCRPFSDTHGYVPKNSPWEITNPHAWWQPVIESDDKGFFYAQEHVTPHIGFDVKPVILTRDELDKIKLDDPKSTTTKRKL